jgi:hypothetical protein
VPIPTAGIFSDVLPRERKSNFGITRRGLC